MISQPRPEPKSLQRPVPAVGLSPALTAPPAAVLQAGSHCITLRNAMGALPGGQCSCQLSGNTTKLTAWKMMAIENARYDDAVLYRLGRGRFEISQTRGATQLQPC